MNRLARRDFLALLAAAPCIGEVVARSIPPVAIARCQSYGPEMAAALSTMFDQLGGLPRLVKQKTVTVKLNLTGNPGLRFQGRPLGVTHYTHPKMAGALAHLLDAAGAKRIRFVESCWATSGPLEEYLLNAGWNLRTLQLSAARVEFENTNALGSGKQYSRVTIPSGGSIFPAYDLNHSYEDTDFFVSLAKLKNHATCGVTLSMKNIFGITPASIYGDDAGTDEPNENPTSGRVNTCHEGKREPSKSAPQERNPSSSRDPGYRMPRIVADLNKGRPIDLSIIDGIETVAGGEGPWVRGLRPVRPAVIVAGTDAVSTDAVATAVMGYNPRGQRDEPPFKGCDNMLTLAEALGVGSANLNRIDVRGVSIADAMYRFS